MVHSGRLKVGVEQVSKFRTEHNFRSGPVATKIPELDHGSLDRLGLKRGFSGFGGFPQPRSSHEMGCGELSDGGMPSLEKHPCADDLLCARIPINWL
jgi:hypothetical protein